MPFSYLEFARNLIAPNLYPSEPNFDPPGFLPLRRPISESTIGVFTSSGIQLRTDIPLGKTNDLSYRLIDRITPLSDLEVAHETPVRAWSQQDLNVVYPRDRLVELEAEGIIGRLAPKAVSMVGSITRWDELLEKTVPALKREYDAQGVDLVLFFPL